MTLTDALRRARRQRAETIAQARAEYDSAKRKAKRVAEANRDARLRQRPLTAHHRAAVVALLGRSLGEPMPFWPGENVLRALAAHGLCFLTHRPPGERGYSGEHTPVLTSHGLALALRWHHEAKEAAERHAQTHCRPHLGGCLSGPWHDLRWNAKLWTCPTFEAYAERAWRERRPLFYPDPTEVEAQAERQDEERRGCP